MSPMFGRLSIPASVVSVARSFGGGLRDLLDPWCCLVCRAPDDPSAVPGLCPTCSRELPWRFGPSDRSPLEVGADRFARIVVALRFEPPVDRLVYQLKYGGQRNAALPLAFALGEAIALAADGAGRTGGERLPELLIPVPMHWLKRWVRGGDHAAWLALALGRSLRLPVATGALTRRRATAAQGGARSLDHRLAQVRGAIAVAQRRSIRGRHVALIDDVVTSGATATACAAALRSAGAASVSLYAVAGNG